MRIKQKSLREILKIKRKLGSYRRNRNKVLHFNLQKYGKYTCELCQKGGLIRGSGICERTLRKLNLLLTIDHITTRKHGGKDNFTNLRVCCTNCQELNLPYRPEKSKNSIDGPADKC